MDSYFIGFFYRRNVFEAKSLAADVNNVCSYNILFSMAGGLKPGGRLIGYGFCDLACCVYATEWSALVVVESLKAALQ